MEYDQEKVDEMVLALLYLTTSSDQQGAKAWKGLDYGTLDRLQKKSFITNLKMKDVSVYLTKEGEKLSKELFFKHFGARDT